MKKIAVVTDSNSGITQEEAQKMGIHVLPMPFTIDGNEYFEGINLTQEEFYEKLKGDADIATSQPSPHAILKLWDELLKEYDEIVHIPMSSGLSGSCQTAAALAADYEDRVFVVNNHRISVTQRRSVDTALAMVKDGKSGQEIKDFLEKTGKNSSIYITVATLKYLKKGGRLTPAVAAIGTMLRLKPVLTIQGEKLDSCAKARTMHQAKQLMIDHIREDIETRFGGVAAHKVHMDIAHTNNEVEALSLDAYCVTNLNLNYTFRTRAARSVSLGLQINNLFNSEYESNGYGYSSLWEGQRTDMAFYFPQAPLNVLGNVTVRF